MEIKMSTIGTEPAHKAPKPDTSGAITSTCKKNREKKK